MDAAKLTALITDPGRVLNRLQRELLRLPPLRRLDEVAWQRALAAHAAQLPPVRPGDEPVLAALEREGALSMCLEDLGLPALDTLSDCLDEVAAPLAKLARDDGMSTRYPLEPVLYRVPLLFHVALDERLLDLAHRHLGLPPRYCALELREDRAAPAVRGIRCWHLDPEDRRMVKVIIYLRDVDRDGGPFEYVDVASSARACAALGYTSGYLDDATVARHAPRPRWRTCVGPAGTLIVADTCRILHRATPPVARPRRSLTLSFTSCRPRKTYGCDRPLGLPALIAGLSPRQRDCLPPGWIAS